MFETNQNNETDKANKVKYDFDHHDDGIDQTYDHSSSSNFALIHALYISSMTSDYENIYWKPSFRKENKEIDYGKSIWPDSFAHDKQKFCLFKSAPKKLNPCAVCDHI